MNLDEYKKMAEMEEYYWWHVGRKFIIENQFRNINLPENSDILNIGCGTGGTVPMLSKFGKVFNVDISDEALAFSKSRGVENLIKVTGIDLPFEKDSFDLVVSLDVIEHIKDDKAALKEWVRVLRPGGIAFIMAPAYQWLWSEHDESLHHYRRYTLNQLSALTPENKVLKKSYLISFTLPLIVGYRLLRKFLPSGPKTTSYVILPKTINSLLVNFLKLESKMLNFINFPFGTSTLLIVKKDGEPEKTLA